jgi:hypothetical protein
MLTRVVPGTNITPGRFTAKGFRDDVMAAAAITIASNT